MAEIKVMISQHYRGGAWIDKATNITFDPRRDMGRVFSFSPALDLSGITESVRKNQLLPADKHTAILFQQLTRDMPVVFPQVVQVRSKRDLVEVVFDRPVYPLPGKLAHIPTQFGVVDILVTDAYMEGNSIAVFPINATGHIQIDADSFVDDNGNTNEAFDAAPKAEPVQAPVEEPVVEEAPVEEPEQVEEVEVKEVKKKPSRKKPAKKEEE
jgi:hypothetical protein